MRRFSGALFALTLAAGLGAGVATAQAPAAKPHATLAQLMRGIFFPNANILFDVQSKDPATFGKKEEGSGASSSFSGIYTGWQVVENAALALAEASNLLTLPGRMCENGRPVPVARPDFIKYAQEMQAAAMVMHKAALTKDQEKASDATNDVAGACENCHIVYRDKGDGPRCVP